MEPDLLDVQELHREREVPTRLLLLEHFEYAILSLSGAWVLH
jgi:hypothetical protein